MSTLKFVPPRVPFTDARTGTITREWYLFLLGVFERIGGATGDSTTDLSASAFDDAGTEETEAALYALSDALNQAPPAIPDQADERALLVPPYEPLAADPDPLADLADLAALRAELDALRTRVQALEAGTTL